MRVKLVILNACVCLLLVNTAGHSRQQNLWTPVYPGALQCEYSSSENVSVFFSRDSYDKLEAFYSSDREVKPIKRARENAQSALFIYKESVHGDAGSIDGVSINYDQAYSPAAGTVFNKLEQLILDGALDRQDFAEVRRRYEHMGHYYSLIGQGKYQEAADLMQKGSAQSLEAARRPADRNVVELWKECLSEMAAEAYPVRLEIGRRR